MDGQQNHQPRRDQTAGVSMSTSSSRALFPVQQVGAFVWKSLQPETGIDQTSVAKCCVNCALVVVFRFSASERFLLGRTKQFKG
uniref:Uncharacterized protein n=1 Tax=Anopheles minimus TaxID=112268 RepID=A0A182VZQ8_9DIPT